MNILKTEQITISLINHLLDGYKTIEEEELDPLTKSIIFGILSESDTPVFLRDAEGKIQMFMYLVEYDTLVKLPVFVEGEDTKTQKIYVKAKGDDIEVTDGFEMSDFEDFRSKIADRIPDYQPIKFYEVFNPLTFNKRGHIKVFGNDDLEIFKTREKIPKYYLITKSSIPELHNQLYKVPLIVEDGEVVAFFGSGFKSLLETNIGTSTKNIDERAFDNVLKIIEVMENIVPSDFEFPEYKINTNENVEVESSK